jgi:hypothetical protein
MKKLGAQSGSRQKARSGTVLGQGWFETISSVEGIKLSPRAKKRAADFDRRGLSHEQRRRAILRAYRQG